MVFSLRSYLQNPIKYIQNTTHRTGCMIDILNEFVSTTACGELEN